jgi:hypothetical protein
VASDFITAFIYSLILTNIWEVLYVVCRQDQLISPVYTLPVEHKCHNILEICYPSLSVQSWFASIIKIKWKVLIQQNSLHNERHRTRSHYALLKKKVRETVQPIPFQQQPATPQLNQWSNLGHPEEVSAKGTNHFTVLKLVVLLEWDVWDM